MVKPNFEEKTYETAYNIELALGRGGTRQVFSPGQVLEKLTGFDVAANPGPSHLIWQVLGATRPPGLSLLPSHWVASPFGSPKISELPRMPVSLILQFKRPEYLCGTRAKQWRLWHRPYYRFARRRDQHSVLTRLEKNLEGVAIVRYAAPAFHTLAELESAQVAGRIIAMSGHVAPNTLRRHQVWTYDKPGAVGRGNPNGRLKLFESFNDLLFSSLFEGREHGGALVQYSGIETHLSALAGACRLRAPRLRAVVAEWATNLSALDLSLSRRQSLIDYATVATLMSWQSSSWWLLDGLDGTAVD